MEKKTFCVSVTPSRAVTPLSYFCIWMAYRYSGYCNSVAIGTTTPGDFCLVDLATSTQNCIEGVGYRDPDFSPTGTNVVFAADFTGQYEIWKATLQSDGTMTNYVQLTRGAANQPSMAPQ